ncbi:hypothetical protein JCM8097_005551 [Rhodosporidiobolus ruineniae]
MPLLRSVALFPLALQALSTAHAAVTPLEPSSSIQVFNATGTCAFKYDLDTTGEWTSFDVDLMSGSNTEMVNLTRVATALDGTTGDGIYRFTCPEVEPNAPIYFYQFSKDGQDPAWTTRFTIAAANGSFSDAPNATQPDGEAIPWGIGALVNSTSSDAAAPSAGWGNSLNPFSQNSTDKPLDEPLLPASATSPTSTTTAWWTAAATSAAGEAQATATGTGGISGFQQGQACDVDSQCPEEAPCCSEKGFCGTGRNCLAGCNPLASFQPGSCAPVPACRSGEYTLSNERILGNSSTWNGDASSYDWLVDSLGAPSLGPLTSDPSSGSSVLTLSLTQDQNGTVLTSTRSVLYGNVTVRMKSVAGAGILTAFSLTSGSKDEIDYEFTTNATDLAETAFFYRGQATGHSTGQQVNISDRAAEYHDYTISWLPDGITWLVDGVAVRYATKESTVDTNGVYHYPHTPSRIQFSIWAAGKEGNSQGLIDFAGGNIDWASPEYTRDGYFASYVSAVTVDCFDPALLPGSFSDNTTMSGAFNSSAGLNETSFSSSTSATPTQNWWEAQQTSVSSAESSSSSTTTQNWWAALQAAKTSSTTTAAGVVQRLGRRVVQLVKRQSGGQSYSYGDLDQNGQVSVSVGSSSTVISDDSATGTNMQGEASKLSPSSASAPVTPTSTDSLSPSSTNASASASSTESPTSAPSASASAASFEERLKNKWDRLSTAARVGIYIDVAAGALFLVVLIGFLWRKAASARSARKGTTPPPDAGGSYYPIDDQGEMLPTGQVYTGTGEIRPGESLYSGGVAPSSSSFSAPTGPQMDYTAAASAPSIARVPTSSSAASTQSAGSRKYTGGGYVPSSQLRAQYGVGADKGEGEGLV